MTSEMFRRLTALRMSPLSLKSHYASPLSTHFRDLALESITYGTCELIIFQFDCTCRQLGVNIDRWLQNIGHAKRVEEPVGYVRLSLE
jgi:hypothetical protein